MSGVGGGYTGMLASCSNCIHQVIDVLYKFQFIKCEAAIYLQSLFCFLDTGTRWCKTFTLIIACPANMLYVGAIKIFLTTWSPPLYFGKLTLHLSTSSFVTTTDLFAFSLKFNPAYRVLNNSTIIFPIELFGC